VIVDVDATSAVPAYEQIRQQVRRMIVSRTLRAGDRLPTINQLANDLGLAPGTVARAYKELEAQGLIETHRRRGTFVAEGWQVLTPNAEARAESKAALDEAVERFVLEVRQLGVDPEVALARARRMLAKGA
jgi:GntR family transcriptional regulator